MFVFAERLRQERERSAVDDDPLTPVAADTKLHTAAGERRLEVPGEAVASLVVVVVGVPKS